MQSSFSHFDFERIDGLTSDKFCGWGEAPLFKTLHVSDDIRFIRTRIVKNNYMSGMEFLDKNQ